ncbi:MAG: hypothetical protein IT481_12215 [Gammaproteobacteria bacterium]|nr:hypothetical protein [Gammaproteobacteria bacterium]
MKISSSSRPHAAVLLLTLAPAAFSQQAPGPTTRPTPPAAMERAADLEPAVDTSARSDTAANRAAPPVTSAPVPSATATPRADAPAADAGPSAAGAARRSDPPARDAAPRRGARAMDRVDLESSQITGNRELPRVLYIVPWRAPQAGELEGRPVNSLLYELTRPVDRDVFRRENRYFDALQAQSPNADAGGGGEGPEK